MAAESPIIPLKMKAVVIHGKKDYRLEEVDVPIPGPNEILVKVALVGICAGDVKCYGGADRFWGTKTLPPYVQPPVTPGHEFCGHVVAVGPGAPAHFRVDMGDFVVAEQIIPCKICRYCLNGCYQMCTDHLLFGFHQKANGAMAKFILFPENARVHKIPSRMDPLLAVYIEPFACSIHGVELANIQFNDVVVVSGCGPIGLGMLIAAKLKNPKILIALDVADFKLDIARSCGADVAINPSKCNLKKEIEALSGGYGCDVYLEASGNPPSVNQGLDIIARLGRFVEFSVFGEKVVADWSIIGDIKEIKIIGGHLGPHCWGKAIQIAASGLIPIHKIVTHKYILRDFQSAIRRVSDSSSSIKIVIDPQHEIRG